MSFLVCVWFVGWLCNFNLWQCLVPLWFATPHRTHLFFVSFFLSNFVVVAPVPNPESNHRRDVFQRQIQSWAGRQQTARDAMSKHAKWLRKFGQEIQGARVNEANHVGPGGKSKPAKAKSVTRGLAANVLSPNVKRAAGLDSKEEVSVEDL